jgi:hypothetical protein
MRRLLIHLLLLVAVGNAGAASAAPSPSPSPPTEAGRGVSVVPAPDSPHRSKSGSFLEFGTLALGVSVPASVVVRSTFDAPRDVNLYSADAAPAIGGGFGFGDRTATPTQVGAWLHLERSLVRIPAGGGVPIGLALTVPVGTPGGEYVGAVIAEPVDQGQSGGVQTRTRFAMAVYLRVPGAAAGTTPGRGRPDGRLQVERLAPRFTGGQSCPVLSYRNDSQSIIDPQVIVRTRGLFGAGTGYSRSRTGALLPGARADVALPCLRRPVGPGRLEVTVRSPVGTTRTAVRFTWLPIAVVLALLFLVILVLALLVTFVRGVRRRTETLPQPASADRPSS